MPDGPAFAITPQWKQRVRDELARRDWSQMDFAALLDVDQSSISTLLGPEAKQTRLAPRIHEVFGWPPPEALKVTDAEFLEAVGLLAELKNSKREMYLTLRKLLVEMLSKRNSGDGTK